MCFPLSAIILQYYWPYHHDILSDIQPNYNMCECEWVSESVWAWVNMWVWVSVWAWVSVWVWVSECVSVCECYRYPGSYASLFVLNVESIDKLTVLTPFWGHLLPSDWFLGQSDLDLWIICWGEISNLYLRLKYRTDTCTIILCTERTNSTIRETAALNIFISEWTIVNLLFKM